MNSVLARPLSGPAYLFEGLRMLRQPGLRRYVVMPVLGNLLIFTLAAIGLYFGIDYAFDRWIPEGWSWLRWLLLPLLALGLLAFGMFAFAVLANLLLSPFLGALSAKVDELQGGRPAPPSKGFFKDLVEDFSVQFRRLGYGLVCLLGVFVLGFVPIVQLLAAPLGVLVSSWLLAVEYASNPLGNRRWSLADQLGLLRAHRWTVVGFGLASFALTLVPIINLVIVPASVVGITLLVRDRLNASGAPVSQ